MKFWLTELNLFSVIKESILIDSDVDGSKSPDLESQNILCHGRILSALSDGICRIFCHTKTAHEL